MFMIDKAMYENLKNWCDRNRPENQFMMYVNSHDRELTNATIRKMMFEITEEDIHGEEYIAFFSAENFYRNMRDYYSEIGNLYRNNPDENDPIEEIIEDYPPTCGWITLIVEDMEAFSGDHQKMEEMLMTLLAFASKRANIILIGNGDYQEVFAGCEYALGEMTVGLNADEEDNLLMIGCYDQDTVPDREKIIYDTLEKHCDELDYYWDTTYEQLKKGYFDYENYKSLFKETMEYLIPRVTKEQVYRKDLWLIENIGGMRREKPEYLEGCKSWEFDAARKFAMGLHKAIVNCYDYHDDFSGGRIGLDVIIEEPDQDYGAIHISSSLETTITVSVDTVSLEMDRLAETIEKCTYKGDTEKLWKYLDDKYNEDNHAEASGSEFEKVGNAMGTVMEGIKKIADKTVNKEPGNKVRRYKGNQAEESIQMPGNEENTGLKILHRDYDTAVYQIKGSDKLKPEQTAAIDDCKVTRIITVLDETRFTINEDGDPEMTQAAQEEYDEFVSDIRQKMMRNEITILDEGYGEDEDELEWHITCCIMNPASKSGIGAVWEIDTCVRAEEFRE